MTGEREKASTKKKLTADEAKAYAKLVATGVEVGTYEELQFTGVEKYGSDCSLFMLMKDGISTGHVYCSECGPTWKLNGDNFHFMVANKPGNKPRKQYIRQHFDRHHQCEQDKKLKRKREQNESLNDPSSKRRKTDDDETKLDDIYDALIALNAVSNFPFAMVDKPEFHALAKAFAVYFGARVSDKPFPISRRTLTRKVEDKSKSNVESFQASIETAVEKGLHVTVCADHKYVGNKTGDKTKDALGVVVSANFPDERRFFPLHFDAAFGKTDEKTEADLETVLKENKLFHLVQKGLVPVCTDGALTGVGAKLSKDLELVTTCGLHNMDNVLKRSMLHLKEFPDEYAKYKVINLFD